MAFIPLPNGVKIELKFRKNGALVVNIIWGTVTIDIGLGELTNITDAVAAWWNANRRADTASTMALEEVIATDWSEPNGLQYVNAIVPPSAGTNASVDLPSNVAAVITFETGYRGRSARGRNYLSGIPEGNVSGNTITTAYVAGMITDYVALQAALAAEGVTHVVASFYTNGAPRVAGQALPVIEYAANNVIDTQRRRIPKVFQ